MQNSPDDGMEYGQSKRDRDRASAVEKGLAVVAATDSAAPGKAEKLHTEAVSPSQGKPPVFSTLIHKGGRCLVTPPSY
jgi:hypothetical protein